MRLVLQEFRGAERRLAGEVNNGDFRQRMRLGSIEFLEAEMPILHQLGEAWLAYFVQKEDDRNADADEDGLIQRKNQRADEGRE